MTYKRFFLTLFLILTLLIAFYYINKSSNINYTPTAYEKDLILYFKEIALQSEYDKNPEKVIKWKDSMVVFIVKEKDYERQILFIKKTIDEINRLATDRYKIVLTNDILKSNSVLYLCSKEKVAELNPNFYKMLNDGINYEISGLSYSEFSTINYVIDKALIFINSEEPIERQESTILEEITQSLGLAFDSELHPNSIFYKNKSGMKVLVKKYSQLDRDVIRLLYHSRMKPGLDSIQVERVIKKILKSEKN
jgi:hypothetical protein